MANCIVCGIPRERHGTYPTCATHEFHACCLTTFSEPVQKDCWDAGRCLSASLPEDRVAVPIEPPLSLLPHLTNYSSVKNLSEHDREVVLARLRTRWLAILEAVTHG